jgi:hypothetical protein
VKSAVLPELVALIVQVAVLVTSTGLPPETFALAVKFWLELIAALAVVGLIVIPVTLGSETVTVAVPLTVPDAPVMVELPGETPVTSPAPLTLATVVSELLQNTLLSVLVVPSL